MDTQLDTSSLHVQVEDVDYLRHGDRKLLATIYRPAGPGPFPGLLEVHGGGWTKNDRLHNARIARGLAARGVMVASIDFRMPPDADYPSGMTDIHFGIRWLKANARRFGSSSEKIGAWGASSGGHQVLLLAMRPTDRRYGAIDLPEAPPIDARLPFVAACWPVVDPLARYRMARTKAEMAESVRSSDAFWRTEAAMAEGNPQMILDRGEKVELPPALIIQGTADTNTPSPMAERFAESYRKAGGSLELHKYEGRIHGYINRDIDGADSIDAMDRIGAFAHAHAAGR